MDDLDRWRRRLVGDSRCREPGGGAREQVRLVWTMIDLERVYGDAAPNEGATWSRKSSVINRAKGMSLTSSLSVVVVVVVYGRECPQNGTVEGNWFPLALALRCEGEFSLRRTPSRQGSEGNGRR